MVGVLANQHVLFHNRCTRRRAGGRNKFFRRHFDSHAATQKELSQ